VKLAEAKSAFVSNVSHELKTPLSLIRLFGETLESGRVVSPEKAHEYYRIIHNESVRLSQLINNILDFAKIESGRKQYNFELADVNELVTSVVETYGPHIISEGFELDTHFEEELPEIAVDRDAVSQAVLNLLSNAVKYSTDTKKITISVRREQGSILIEVADLGIGIPKSEQSKIFEKFYRVGSELVHNTKGTGLGLSLVKHIVEAHQGQVRVQSAPGKGSTFTLVLPTGQPQIAAERSKDLRYGLAQNLNR
jgi:signal transduction histidine kinase